MNTFIYVSNASTRESLAEYSHLHFKDAAMIVEKASLLLDWNKRVLNDVLANARKGDTIAVFDALNLARSYTQVLSFLEAAWKKGVEIQFIKYDLVFKTGPAHHFTDLLDLIRHIEGDFVSQRNREILRKRTERGITLGRPKGRQNKFLKLDKYKKDIAHYLTLSISKASIARLVHCHPQTLYNWIERNEAEQKASTGTKTKKPEAV